MSETITIHIFYTGQNGSARAFADEMTASGLVARIRAEEGNLGYAYYYPAEDPETVLLIDRWRDQGAIDAHHKSEMMSAIAELRKKYHLKMRVERFHNAD
ncbi:antibiotic biosynthesis monooxygenase [Gemmiger formicilis]|uniref:putative quinol monooxygenase n=1 Tax=Gemmiger formicilis TaxID=745368 RepID=UPI0019590414|nr:putative quinol monooxygenase [Gemmiger formicilis]MBM6717766.1 antibiotic biosynthesis monooxygenase [Gemmiger formicilis]